MIPSFASCLLAPTSFAAVSYKRAWVLALALVQAERFDKREEWAGLMALRRRGRLAVEMTLSPGDGELLRIR
jgi:hypothetical protein